MLEGIMSDLDIWTEALEEAYAAAPASSVLISTIELRHSTFVDDEDNPVAIRMVQDPGILIEERDDGPDIYGLMLTLEDSAPLDAGESVLFQSVMFKFTLPEQSDSRVTGMRIEFDNVTRIMSDYLDEAVKARSAMSLIYREYLEDDLTTPQLIIPNLSIKSVTSNIWRVTGNAEFTNFLDKKFPNKEYRPEEFPGLQA
jgi:hypothetical protein